MAILRTRKSAEERKSEIVDAALRLAGEIGPDRMTTEALAREVGLSQSGIFRHFPTKEAIWDSIGKHIGSLLQAKTSLTRKKNTCPADELRDYVVSHLAFVEATPAIPAILFSRELHAENDKLRRFFAGLIASRHAYISKLVAAGIDAGDFRKSINPDDAAYLILAFIQGMAMRWSLNARSFDLAGEGKRLLELQLEGFKAPDRNSKS